MKGSGKLRQLCRLAETTSMDFTKDSIEIDCSQNVGDESVKPILDDKSSNASQHNIAESALSPWEKWVIKKAKDERERRESDRQLKVGFTRN